jgi:hypothetical protein
MALNLSAFQVRLVSRGRYNSVMPKQGPVQTASWFSATRRAQMIWVDLSSFLFISP